MSNNLVDSFGQGFCFLLCMRALVCFLQRPLNKAILSINQGFLCARREFTHNALLFFITCRNKFIMIAKGVDKGVVFLITFKKFNGKITC